MATYRVGEAGARVFDSEGRLIRFLRPGWVVVEESVDTPGSEAERDLKAKQQRGYADKMVRPAEDKG